MITTPARSTGCTREILAILAVIVFLMFMSIGCVEPGQSENKRRFYNGYRFSVIELEGCEYVTYHSGRGAAMVHKANCKNPEHLMEMYGKERERLQQKIKTASLYGHELN